MCKESKREKIILFNVLFFVFFFRSYAVRSLGVDVVGVAGVTYEQGEDPLSDASYVLWKKMRTVIMALMRGNYFPKHRAPVQRRLLTPSVSRKLIDEVGLTAPASGVTIGPPERQVTYHLAQPVTQGVPSHVRVSTDFLRSRGVEADADLAVVIDSRIPEISFDFGPDSKTIRLNYRDIPNFPESNSQAGSLSFVVTAQKKKVIILHGTFLYNEGRNNAEIGHSIRVLQQLQVGRVVFINEVVSYSRQAPIDSLVLVRDHFNLAGSNPLFGKNVPEFGIRFSDLGNLYTDTLRHSVRRCAQKMDLTVSEVTCAFVVGPVFASLADAAVVVQACDAQVACTGMIPEVLVARHANMQIAAIGVVKTFVLPGDVRSANKFRGRNSRNISGLIGNLLNRL